MNLNKDTLRKLVIEELQQSLSEEQLEEFFGAAKAAAQKAGSAIAGGAKKVAAVAKRLPGAVSGANKWADDSSVNKELDFGEKALSVRKKVHTTLNKQQVKDGLETLKGDMASMQPMMQARVMAIMINKLGLGSDWFKKNHSRIRSDLEKGAKTASANMGGSADARFKTGSRGGSKDKGGDDLGLKDVFLEDSMEEMIKEELTKMLKEN